MLNEYGFFASKDHDRKYSSEDFTALVGDIFNDGVLGFGTSSLKVSTCEGMSVSISVGTAYIKGHWYRIQSPQTLKLDNSDKTYDRIDAIVVRCDFEKRKVYPCVISGTPDTTAVKPLPIRDSKYYDLVLAYVTIPAKCTEIVSDNITDSRDLDDVCGFISSDDFVPTFTEPESLNNIANGEKLSVVFGKISKAISDLISHISDKVSHITTSERTKWNSSQENVIEKVKVNGTALVPKSKAVDIAVPTKVSELENDKGFKTTDTTYDNATTGKAGLMSAEDKTTLNAIPDTYALKSKYGDTTINVGRKAGTTVGTCSTAEGNGTTASGKYSHAEGTDTTASGINSHAEGKMTTASGVISHTEGFNTTASGNRSHAGGINSISSGENSFAHGDNVNANNDNEVAFGKYNNSYSGLLFSIGDGKDSDNTHNAFEVTSRGARVKDQVVVTTKSVLVDNVRIDYGSMSFSRITSANSYTVEFSNSFATLYDVIVTLRDTTCSSNGYAIVTNKSETGFTVKASYSIGFDWVAIGSDEFVEIGGIGGGAPVG